MIATIDFGDARYRVAGWPKVAWYLLGYFRRCRETLPELT